MQAREGVTAIEVPQGATVHVRPPSALLVPAPASHQLRAAPRVRAVSAQGPFQSLGPQVPDILAAREQVLDAETEVLAARENTHSLCYTLPLEVSFSTAVGD